MKIIIYISLLIPTSLLNADEIEDLLLDTAIDSAFHNGKEVNNKRDKFDFDKATCEQGSPSPIIANRRAGCVNEKTQLDNYNDFKEYSINRDEYLLNQNAGNE